MVSVLRKVLSLALTGLPLTITVRAQVAAQPVEALTIVGKLAETDLDVLALAFGQPTVPVIQLVVDPGHIEFRDQYRLAIHRAQATALLELVLQGLVAAIVLRLRLQLPLESFALLGHLGPQARPRVRGGLGGLRRHGTT